MIFTKKHRQSINVLLILLVLLLSIIGVGLGLALSTNINNKNIENFIQEKPSLPSVILDRNGEVISELVGQEQRTLLEFNDLPKNQVLALLAREDAPFFEHSGFSVRGFTRAIFSLIKNRNLAGGGGSTLTQQLAKIRRENIFRRNIFTKLEELWETWQIERQYSKQEIMQMYLNKVNFGHGAYGIEAVSNYFFEHSARDNSVAESVMCAIQVARPFLYSPDRRPKQAKKVQRRVLDQMVTNGFVSKEEADKSFATYWSNHDWSRDSSENVHDTRNRQDKAPWFTEYVREELKNLLYGTQDPYKDGYKIHTTLDLDYQAAADKFVLDRLKLVREQFKKDSNSKKETVYNQFSPIISMLGLVGDIKDIKVESKVKTRKEKEFFHKSVVPELRTLSLLTGIGSLNNVSQIALKESGKEDEGSVETALISVENGTGKILALIGGSKFEYLNQYNRALMGKMTPGSSFKPLYYSAGISTNQLNAGYHFMDQPKTFELDGSEPYSPGNYGGRWYGHILLREALYRSLNIAAVESLGIIGFDAAIDRSTALLGITDPGYIRVHFPRKYPLALGPVTVNPSQMARAYSTFANGGRANDAYGIRFIESQKGAIIAHVEDEMTQKSYSPKNQIMSAQDAYIMTSILKSSVYDRGGTLNFSRIKVGGYDGMPMAGKTGTTQNWKDSWAVGYSPYLTTSLWYGFDKGNHTLGTNNSGGVLAARVWSYYMKEIHKDLPVREFHRPEGIIERNICTVSGDLHSQKCPSSEKRREIFKIGTQPTSFCVYHSFVQEARNDGINKIMDTILIEYSPDEQLLDEYTPDLINPYDPDEITDDEDDGFSAWD